MKVSKFFRKLRHYSGSNAIRKKLGLTGKRIKSRLLGTGRVTSAGSYAYNRGEYYGPTGSIVGRY